MAIHLEPNHFPFPVQDALFNEEENEQLGYEEESIESEMNLSFNQCFQNCVSNPDLISGNEDILALFSKEKDIQIDLNANAAIDRKSAIEWMIRANTHFGFEALTAILAVNYFDRFVSKFAIESDDPWMSQLIAVACLSLAAKVEEPRVPLLLDFQVEGAEFMFEAKTLQRMELLVLTTLEWKMNPVTPLSYVDHVITRPEFKSHLPWAFLSQCNIILLSLLADLRFMRYLPSVLAAVTMLLVIQDVEPSKYVDYQNQLLAVLNLTWENVDDCYNFVVEVVKPSHQGYKRKYEQISKCLSSSVADNTHGPKDELSNGPSVSSSSPEVQPHKRMIIATPM